MSSQDQLPLDIVLFDANSYYASCHQAVNPDLRGHISFLETLKRLHD